MTAADPGTGPRCAGHPAGVPHGIDHFGVGWAGADHQSSLVQAYGQGLVVENQ